MYQKRFLGRSSFNSNIFKGQKGQVTVFIIFGILLLLALALIVAFRKEIINFKPEEVFPTEKGKIEHFITSCMESVGTEALEKLGMQGGYIEVPAEISLDGNRHLQTSPFTVVPYWAYGPNTDIPPLPFMEQEINHYLEDNLHDCIFGTQAFRETYTIVEKSGFQADTTITNSKVIFNLHWDVEIRDRNGEVIAELNDHVAESDIKLKQAYDTAKLIVEQEMRGLKLEDITQDLIALEHPNVPVAGMDVSCEQKKWKIETVKETLKDILRVNIRELKVTGTDVVNFPEDLPYYQNHYFFDMGDDFAQPNVAVLFNFQNNYPFSFEVTPRSGIYMKSNQLGGSTDLLSLLCLQTWKFVYSVSYPVLVTVKDQTTNYNFNIAFTVHLKNNYPDRSETISPTKTVFYDPVTDEQYCTQSPVPMTVATYKLVEDPQSGVYFREPLEDVDISFSCLKYHCELGKTEYDFAGKGDIAAYSANFPYCVGGIVRGTKEGYKESWSRIVTTSHGQAELDLAPLISVPASGIKVLRHDLNGNEVESAMELKSDETALIKLTYRKNNQTIEPFHESSMIISSQLDPMIQSQQKLEFLAEADFRYYLEINIINNEKIVAGYKGNWTVPWKQLQNAREITFHAVGKKGSDEDQFELALGLERYSTLVPQPEIK